MICKSFCSFFIAVLFLYLSYRISFFMVQADVSCHFDISNAKIYDIHDADNRRYLLFVETFLNKT